MSIWEMLRDALSPIGLPVVRDFYDPDADPENLDGGMPEAYIVCNLSDQRPDFWADDQPDTDASVWQVHYFNRVSANRMRTIRRALRQAGFTIGSLAETYESDTKYRHAILNVSICVPSEEVEE